MKAVKKRSHTLFLAGSLLLALFLGFRWLDRSREFSSLLPFSLQEVTACYATLECFYLDDPAQEKSLHTQLTQAQTKDLLEQLSQSTYRREGSGQRALHGNKLSDPDLSPHLRLQSLGADAERRTPAGQPPYLSGRFRCLPPGRGQSGPIPGTFSLFAVVYGVTHPTLSSPSLPGALDGGIAVYLLSEGIKR